MQERKIEVYDSLGESRRGYLDIVFRYIQDEHADKKKVPLPDKKLWKLIPGNQRNMPQQDNNCDCGVFTCMAFDFLTQGYRVDFTTEQAAKYRQRMALTILNGRKVINSFLNPVLNSDTSQNHNAIATSMKKAHRLPFSEALPI